MYTGEHKARKKLSIRMGAEVKKRLGALLNQAKRSKPFVEAEATTAYPESEEWQVGELRAGMAELDRDKAFVMRRFQNG